MMKTSSFLDDLSDLIAEIDRNVTDSDMHPDAKESVAILCEVIEGFIDTRRQMDKIFSKNPSHKLDN